VPRTGHKVKEKFWKVVITEGEFKAAALWQVVGGGRDDGKDPWGVVALPGITFAKTYEVREALNHWIWSVGAREVVVAYDNEEKGDPSLESYKADKRKRYDAIDLGPIPGDGFESANARAREGLRVAEGSGVMARGRRTGMERSRGWFTTNKNFSQKTTKGTKHEHIFTAGGGGT
jgi:hypothetical protein